MHPQSMATDALSEIFVSTTTHCLTSDLAKTGKARPYRKYRDTKPRRDPSKERQQRKAKKAARKASRRR